MDQENNQQPTPNPTASVSSMQAGVKQAQMEKAEKDRVELQKKQLAQANVNDKNTKKLTGVLEKITDVLKGAIPKGKDKQNIQANGLKDAIGKGLKEAVSNKTSTLRSMGSVKGIAGLMAAKYADNPGSIAGSIFGAIHGHMEAKHQSENLKKDFGEGYLEGTNHGRELKQKQELANAERLEQLKEENKKKSRLYRKSDEDLAIQAKKEGDEKLKSRVSHIYKKKENMQSSLDELDSKEKSLKARNKNFSLSDEDTKLREELRQKLKELSTGQAGKQLDEKIANRAARNALLKTPHNPEYSDDQLAKDEERDKAMALYKQHNSIEGDLTPGQEKQFEKQYEAGKRAREEHDAKLFVANRTKEEAEKHWPTVAAESKASGLDVDVNNPQHKEEYLASVFKESMDAMATLSKSQLEQLIQLRKDVEGDNKSDKANEQKAEKEKADQDSKINPTKVPEANPVEGKGLKNPDLLGKEKAVKKSEDGMFKGILNKLKGLGGEAEGIFGSFGGVISKVLPMLGTLAGAIGIVGVAAGAGTMAINAVSDHFNAKLDKETSEKMNKPDIEVLNKMYNDRGYISEDGAAKLEAAGVKVDPDKILKKGLSAEERTKWISEHQKDKPQVPAPEAVPEPEKPPVVTEKEVIDEKQEEVDKAKEERAAALVQPAPSISPVISNTTNNNNTTVMREPVRNPEPELPWRANFVG